MVLQAASLPSPAAAAWDNFGGGATDPRQLVAFPDPLRILTLANMRDHLVALQDINAALSRGEFDKAAGCSSAPPATPPIASSNAIIRRPANVSAALPPRTMKRTIAGAVLALGFLVSPLATAANTWGTDLSDLWWNPNENGWGVNIAHQREILFITLFVYDAGNRAHWYVGPATASASAYGGNYGDYVFTGALYETTGPHFGAATFDPNAVGVRQVGNVTARFTDVSVGTLSYNVDGVTVTKAIQRQTFRTASLAGQYLGASSSVPNACGAQAPSAKTALWQVQQTGDSVTITEAANVSGVACTYTGFYTQAGRMGRISGTATCSNGTSASRFLAYEVEASYRGFTLTYQADWGGGCTTAGYLGGIKLN